MKATEHSNANNAQVDVTRLLGAGDLLPVGGLGRLTQRFGVGADWWVADALQRPSEHKVVIRLSAMGSTLNWAASEIRGNGGAVSREETGTDKGDFPRLAA